MEIIKLIRFSFSSVMDAQGMMPPGLAGGNLFWPGFYDQCVRASGEINLNSTGEQWQVTGKHCMAEFEGVFVSFCCSRNYSSFDSQYLG